MKSNLLALFALLESLASSHAYARDDHLKFSIQEALETPTAKEKVGKDIKLYFHGQANPEPKKKILTVTANRKTNAFNKTDKEACQWVFLSSVLALQERARKEGGNAVIGIRSVYRNTITESSTEYMCGAGAIMAGVALEGTIVQE